MIVLSDNLYSCGKSLWLVFTLVVMLYIFTSVVRLYVFLHN